VPAAAQRAVEDRVGAGEQRFDLAQQHRDVVGANARRWKSTDRAHTQMGDSLGRVMLVRC
jgi:hypothetical protein